jgi:hypothetical protein
VTKGKRHQLNLRQRFSAEFQKLCSIEGQTGFTAIITNVLWHDGTPFRDHTWLRLGKNQEVLAILNQVPAGSRISFAATVKGYAHRQSGPKQHWQPEKLGLAEVAAVRVVAVAA